MDRRLLGVALALLAVSAAFLLVGLRAPRDVILSLRLPKLAALVLVGAATGVATVIFQTITESRLLTPGIIGFDALFVLLQTLLVASLGAAGFGALPDVPRFALETATLTGAALALFGTLLRRGAADILKLALTGLILGVMLRGLANLGQRLLDPTDFALVQQASVASFTAVAPPLLAVSALAVVGCLAAGQRLAPQLDLVLLGRDKAMSLGLDHDRLVRRALALVAVTVAVSTALAGPLAFLGLLASGLAHALLPAPRHAVLLPMAALMGALILVAGQALFERFLGLQSSLAVVVEFAGGILFLLMVLRESHR